MAFCAFSVFVYFYIVTRRRRKLKDFLQSFGGRTVVFIRLKDKCLHHSITNVTVISFLWQDTVTINMKVTFTRNQISLKLLGQ